MIETNNNETTSLKRTHKKPYKVGKLFFGRSSNQRGASWLVSESPDLSSPMATFDIGKLARAYCEEQRDLAKSKKAFLDAVPSAMDADVEVPDEVGIPSGEEPFELLGDLTEEGESIEI